MYTFVSLSRQNKNVVYLSLCLIKNHEKALTVEKCLPSHLWAAVAGVVAVFFYSFGFEDGKIDIDGPYAVWCSCRGSQKQSPLYSYRLTIVLFAIENSSKNVLLTRSNKKESNDRIETEKKKNTAIVDKKVGTKWTEMHNKWIWFAFKATVFFSPSTWTCDRPKRMKQRQEGKKITSPVVRNQNATFGLSGRYTYRRMTWMKEEWNKHFPNSNNKREKEDGDRDTKKNCKT